MDNSQVDFVVKPLREEKDTAVDQQIEEAKKWQIGQRARVTGRVSAYDPFAREQFTVFPHTPVVIAASRGSVVMAGCVTVILRSADNGAGRIAEIDPTYLVG